jgi:pimeloyl-ACP methyl ester carboxylesterase
MNSSTAQSISFIAGGGLALAARHAGPEAADLTVILLHGPLGDSDSWHCQLRHLAQAATLAALSNAPQLPILAGFLDSISEVKPMPSL